MSQALMMYFADLDELTREAELFGRTLSRKISWRVLSVPLQDTPLRSAQQLFDYHIDYYLNRSNNGDKLILYYGGHAFEESNGLLTGSKRWIWHVSSPDKFCAQHTITVDPRRSLERLFNVERHILFICHSPFNPQRLGFSLDNISKHKDIILRNRRNFRILNLSMEFSKCGSFLDFSNLCKRRECLRSKIKKPATFSVEPTTMIRTLLEHAYAPDDDWILEMREVLLKLSPPVELKDWSIVGNPGSFPLRA